MSKLKVIHRLLLSSFLLLIICVPLLSSASILNPDTSMEPPKLQIPIPGMEPFQASVPDSLGSISNSWIAEYIVAIYRYGIGIIGIVAMIAIAYGGIRRVVSMGNPGSISESKAWINSGLAGLALGLGSYMMLSMINTDLVNFKNITIDSIEDPEPEFTAGGSELTGAYIKDSPTFKTNVSAYDSMLRKAADKYQVDCNVLKALMMAETGGVARPSPVGAQGLMQLMPTTFATLETAKTGGDINKNQDNIYAGAEYIKLLQSKACGGQASNKIGCNAKELKYFIAAYNGGPKANNESRKPSCFGKTAWECPANWNPAKPKSYLQTYNHVGKVKANLDKINSTPGWGC